MIGPESNDAHRAAVEIRIHLCHGQKTGSFTRGEQLHGHPPGKDAGKIWRRGMDPAGLFDNHGSESTSHHLVQAFWCIHCSWRNVSPSSGGKLGWGVGGFTSLEGHLSSPLFRGDRRLGFFGRHMERGKRHGFPNPKNSTKQRHTEPPETPQSVAKGPCNSSE